MRKFPFYFHFTYLLQLFTDCQKGKEGVLAHFYKYFKAISLASFIQIFFIYKWHAKNFDVLFFAYDVKIQYGRSD